MNPILVLNNRIYKKFEIETEYTYDTITFNGAYYEHFLGGSHTSIKVEDSRNSIKTIYCADDCIISLETRPSGRLLICATSKNIY